MSATGFDVVNGYARIKRTASLPTLPYQFYGVAANDVAGTEWVGGEIVYNSGDNRIYVQQSTSGLTAVWKRLATQLATTTTSSSTSTSTSTSSSSSTSTSTSSTTTMA